MSAGHKEDFTKVASEESESNTFAELWNFLSERKKWWLLPIVLMLLLFGTILVLSGTGVAPFIYSLF